MKKLVLPQNRSGYTPQGIYAFSKDQRKSAFEKLMNNTLSYLFTNVNNIQIITFIKSGEIVIFEKISIFA